MKGKKCKIRIILLLSTLTVLGIDYLRNMMSKWALGLTKIRSSQGNQLPKRVSQTLSGMDMEFNIGMMGLIMKVSGHLIKLKGKGHFGMLKAMFTRGNSRTIWPMGMETTHISTDPSTKASSEMMYKKGMEKKSGLMEPSMWARTKTE